MIKITALIDGLLAAETRRLQIAHDVRDIDPDVAQDAELYDSMVAARKWLVDIQKKHQYALWVIGEFADMRNYYGEVVFRTPDMTPWDYAAGELRKLEATNVIVGEQQHDCK